MKKLTIASILLLALSACTADGPEELRTKAAAAIAANDGRTAEIHLKNLLQKEGKDAEARLQLANIYMARGNWPSAEKELRRAREFGMPTDRIAVQLIEAMAFTSEPGEILEEVESFTTSDTTVRASLYYFSALAQMKLGETKSAVTNLQSAIALKPDLLKAKVVLLTLKAQDGESAMIQSISELTALQQIHPDDIALLLAKGDLLVKQKEFDAGRETFDRAYELAPDNPEVLVRMAALRIGQANYAEAAPLIENAIKLAPNSPVVLTLKAQLDYSSQNYGAALDAATAALNGAPDYLPAVSVAAAAALANGSLERAESFANQFRNLEPNSVKSYEVLATVFMRKQQPDRVLDLLNPLFASGLRDPALLTLAGRAAMATNNPAEASRFLSQAVDVAPGDQGKRVYLAMAKLSAGDTSGGLGDLQSAVELNPDSPSASHVLINELIRARKFDEAIEAIAELEKQHPGQAENRYLAGLVRLNQRDFKAARSSFEQALQLNSRLVPAIAGLAAIDLSEGRRDESIARLRQLLQEDPDNRSALILLAKLHARVSGEEKEALELIERARKAHPEAVEPILMLAAVHLKTGTADKAEEALRAGLTANPNQPGLLEALARAQKMRGSREQALETIDKLAALQSNNAAIQYRLAAFRSELGDLRGALRGYQTVRQLVPNDLRPRINIAITQHRMGNKNEAMATAREIQRDMPKIGTGWLIEAELHRAENQWKRAADAYEKAVDIEPEKIAAYLKLDGALRRSGQVEKADARLAKRLSAQPDNAVIQRYAGDVASTRKDFPTAIKHYKKSVALAPSDAVSWNNLAWSQQQIGDSDALASAERAITLDPDSAATMDTVAGILANAGQFPRAIELQRKAVAQKPNSSTFRLHLAEILKQAGNTGEAQEMLKTLLATTPSGPDAEAARELLNQLK